MINANYMRHELPEDDREEGAAPVAVAPAALHFPKKHYLT